MKRYYNNRFGYTGSFAKSFSSYLFIKYYHGGNKSHTFRKKSIRPLLEPIHSWNSAHNMYLL